MKTKASIKFGFVDVTAKEDSNLTVNDKQNFVDILDLKEDDLEEIKYGTCEKNQFALDGSFELMPDVENLDNMGWWSYQMSNEVGNFATPLVMEINFSEVHSSLGLTFVFSEAGDFCSKLNLKYYDLQNNLISDVNFNPDSYIYVCNNIVENYAKIVVSFFSTNNPFRYLKVYKILYGADIVFEGDNLMNANILEEVDLLSSEVSINTLDFTTYSADDKFNIINPKGFYSLLQQRQKLDVTETFIKDNKVKEMGTFYLDTWANEKDKIMKFGAIDLIGIIDKTDFKGGMYTIISFYDLIKEIMTSVHLTEEDFEIEEDLKNVTLTGYIPICTHREALQQAVFAVGAVADCSRSSKIKIYTVKDQVENAVIERTNVFQDTKKLEQNELVTGVSIVAHNFTLGNEIEKLYDGTLDKGETKILFNEPVHDLTCSGGTIIESNCNYAVVSVSETSDVVVNGYKYKDNLQTYLVEVENLNISQKQNTLKIESAYLVNKSNAVSVAKKVLNYYQKTYKTSFDFLLKDECLSDDVQLEGDFEQKFVGHITKLDIDLTGGFLASTELNARVREASNNG